MPFQKIVVFLSVTILFFYMVRLLTFTKKRWEFRTYTFIVLIGGLVFFDIATLFDIFTYKKHYEIISAVIKICFTLGTIFYVIGVMLWGNYTKKAIEKFEKIALTDPMTGALNRKGLEDIYNKLIKVGNSFYVILCDLNGTKRINDTFGHLNGDKYISNTTKILMNIIGVKGNVARIGGDEFIILLNYVEDDELNQIVSKIKYQVHEFLPQENTGISLGYSLFPKDGIDFNTLINVADKKMYNDKKSAKMYR